MKFPLWKQDTWYHVGDMEKKMKKSSYEGAGLSISDVPNSWRRIARLSGEVYKLEKEGGRFLNMVYLSIPLRKEIFEWAVAKEYLLTENIWVYYFYDEEYDDFYEREFSSEEEARIEVDWDDLDEEERALLMKRNKQRDNPEEEFAGTLYEVKRYQATEKLLKLEEWTGSCMSQQAEDFAIMRYAEEVLKLDGVYWDEEHDPVRLSAPRAVIFQSQLHNWSYQKAVSQ